MRHSVVVYRIERRNLFTLSIDMSSLYVLYSIVRRNLRALYKIVRRILCALYSIKRLNYVYCKL